MKIMSNLYTYSKIDNFGKHGSFVLADFIYECMTKAKLSIANGTNEFTSETKIDGNLKLTCSLKGQEFTYLLDYGHD